MSASGPLFRIQNSRPDAAPFGKVRTLELKMDITKMLAELRQEREQIEEAILTLERLARGQGKRRGRPPLWLTEARKRGGKGSKAKSASAAKTSE